MLKEFRDFLFRGNIIELAVAFVMGLAFAGAATRSCSPRCAACRPRRRKRA